MAMKVVKHYLYRRCCYCRRPMGKVRISPEQFARLEKLLGPGKHYSDGVCQECYDTIVNPRMAGTITETEAQRIQAVRANIVATRFQPKNIREVVNQ